MPDNQIRHIVLCKLSAGCEAAFESIVADLEGLTSHLSMGQVRHGTNTSPEGLERGYLHGFTIDFPDQASLQTYLDDADHKAIGARLVDLCEGGIDGLLVLDI